jgi:hypothetical protein
MVKKILLALFVLLVGIQFIQPAKNVGDVITENDISKKYEMPEAVHSIFVQKCYDCHSNNTLYPWYSKVQPVAWWINSHVEEGKEKLNFSEFTTYTEKKANHKLEEVSEAVTDGWMPLDSYVLIHRETKITTEDTKSINAWIKSLGVTVKGEARE